MKIEKYIITKATDRGKLLEAIKVTAFRKFKQDQILAKEKEEDMYENNKGKWPILSHQILSEREFVTFLVNFIVNI